MTKKELIELLEYEIKAMKREIKIAIKYEFTYKDLPYLLGQKATYEFLYRKLT